MFKSVLFCLLNVGFLTINTFAQQKPNIVFIMADDLGYGDLGCYGQTLIKTPNLDQMAARGMKFTQFYAGAPVCAPSRASLMTGLHTGHAAVRGNKEIKPEGQFPLPANSVTIAEQLKEAGYISADFGKWGLGFVGSTGDPNKQGFDQFFGYNCQRQSHNYYPDHLWDNATRVNYPGNKQSNSVYSAEEIQRKALNFINRKKDRPFFLYLSFTLPHAALQVPQNATFEYYKKLFKEKPAPPSTQQGDYVFQRYPRTAYATMVTLLDDYVGQVLNALKQQGLADNTLVFFTSDNGPHIEGGNDPYFFNSSGGLRGIKRDVYEGGIREPFIAYWPNKVEANTVSDYKGAFCDVLPTLNQLAGIETIIPVDGISFVNALMKNGEQRQHEYLYWEFHEKKSYNGKQAIRLGDWKGVRFVDGKDEKFELYNLATDLAEKNNVSSKYPEVSKKIKLKMMEAHNENDDFPLIMQGK